MILMVPCASLAYLVLSQLNNSLEQIGDASASASPLSFGGFGSMIRHLERLVDGLDEALSSNSLSVSKLQLLQVEDFSNTLLYLSQLSQTVHSQQPDLTPSETQI